jgi:hypothetical protein
MVLLIIGLLTEVFATVRPYLGPDNLLPLASIIAAAAGLVMLFWGRAKGLVRKALGRSHPADAETDDSTKETDA